MHVITVTIPRVAIFTNGHTFCSSDVGLAIFGCRPITETLRRFLRRPRDLYKRVLPGED